MIEKDADIPPIDEQVGPETKEEGREKRKKKAEAVDVLRQLFMGDNPPDVVRASDVINAWPLIYANAWIRARKEVGVRTFEKDGVWWWSLK